MAPVDYADGVSAARLIGRPNPRSVGTRVVPPVRVAAQRQPAVRVRLCLRKSSSHDTQRTVGGSTEVVEFRIPVGDDIFLANHVFRCPLALRPGHRHGTRESRANKSTSPPLSLTARWCTAPNELTASILRGGPANPGAKLRTSNDINGDSENLLPRDAFGPGRTHLSSPETIASTTTSSSLPCTRCSCANITGWSMCFGRSSGVGH